MNIVQNGFAYNIFAKPNLMEFCRRQLELDYKLLIDLMKVYCPFCREKRVRCINPYSLFSF